MILPVRGLVRGATFVAALTLMSIFGGAAQARASHGRARASRPPEPRVAPGLRVSVQPIAGEHGPALRAQIARILRGRGCRVTTALAAVSGTGQYPELARDNRLSAFVVADLVEGTRRGRPSRTSRPGCASPSSPSRARTARRCALRSRASCAGAAAALRRRSPP